MQPNSSQAMIDAEPGVSKRDAPLDDLRTATVAGMPICSIVLIAAPVATFTGAAVVGKAAFCTQ